MGRGTACPVKFVDGYGGCGSCVARPAPEAGACTGMRLVSVKDTPKRFPVEVSTISAARTARLSSVRPGFRAADLDGDPLLYRVWRR